MGMLMTIVIKYDYFIWVSNYISLVEIKVLGYVGNYPIKSFYHVQK